jgi:two-component system, NtrC family, nitrogen regulation sensor histidine kinase GlnL
VEQVLTASGPLRLKTEPINIHQLLHQALRTAGAHAIPTEEVVIEQLFDPSLPELSGDAAALERVFVNLVQNGLEAIAAVPGVASESKLSQLGWANSNAAAAPRESHKLRLKTALEPQLRMSAGRRRQFLRVEISDTGKGMTPEEFQQLFTPFFTTKSSGTGLGLVLSQRIITQHGGKLWAQLGSAGSNGPNIQGDQPRGMTFCVTLPIGPD